MLFAPTARCATILRLQRGAQSVRPTARMNPLQLLYSDGQKREWSEEAVTVLDHSINPEGHEGESTVSSINYRHRPGMRARTHCVTDAYLSSTVLACWSPRV